MAAILSIAIFIEIARMTHGFLMTLFFSLLSFLPAAAAPPAKDLYEIRIYHLKTREQVQQVNEYLKDAWLPAVHRAGISKVGIFEPVGNDTAAAKSIYILLPLRSAKQLLQLQKRLMQDEAYLSASQSFRAAPSDHPPYERLESILLEAFDGQKHWVLPQKNAAMVFELRSYESPTEKLHEKKMAMFEHEEIALFKKLDFHTVFYARVISGSHMPNFMYMPSFSSIDERNAHWKIFSADPQWKEMSNRPENENKVSVSHIESTLMHAAAYSDL